MKKIAIIAFVLSVCLSPLRVLAQSAAGTTIGGTVTDESQHPIAGAAVTFRGPSSYSATTDSKGRYTVANVAPGAYAITFTKGGYQSLELSTVVPAGKGPLVVDARLPVASFSSMRTIAVVSTRRQENFNTSTAAVNVVSSADFSKMGATQVTATLNQVPGVQISLPGSSANGAAPGAITFPNVRDGLSYETASLIDGHPLSVGLYGDYVTTFLSPYLLQDAEVIKGPGATSPQVNYAINGTVNFRTKDPTPNVDTFYTAGVTNFGGATFAFGASDTLGRLGFVAGLSGYDEPSAVHNIGVYFDPGTGSGYLGNGAKGINLYPYGCSGLGGSSSPTPLLGTSGSTFFSRVYNGCAAVATTVVSGDFNNRSELLKLRYRIGDRTSLTASYLGSQSLSNQSGNLSNVIPSIFQPGAGYSGSLKAGTVIDVLSAAYNAQPQYETNNEPIFQLELSTGFANDTLLARYYHATIERVQSAGLSNPFEPYLQNTNVYGTLSTSPALTFNGGSYQIDQFNYFNDPEVDELTGYSLEYTHPFGTSNDLTFAADYTGATSVDYSNDVSYNGNQCQIGNLGGGYCYNTSTSLPSGAGQYFTTALLRDHEQFNSKLSATFAYYQNVYHSAFPIDCASFYDVKTTDQTTCTPNGQLQTYTTGSTTTPVSTVPVTYGSSTLLHGDPRIGVEWRPQNSVAVRLSAGSSIAPPFLYVISQPNGGITVPSHPGPAAPAVETINAGNLRPETAFGYDAGADYAFHDPAMFASVDFYLTDLYGQFLQETYFGGTCPPSACAPKPPVPLEYSQYVNLSNARYQGIELGIKRVPQTGLGFEVQGSTQQGYPYNLPPTFYCQFKITKAHPCVPSNYNVNLNILANQDYQGEYIDAAGGTTSGVSNQSVPYLQGNAEVSYHLRNGAFALFGETLYGKNNSFNRPPFDVAYASINYPVAPGVALQLSGSNLFNAYNGFFPVYGGGVTVPLANGLQAGTIGNVLGPPRYLLLLTKSIGPSNPGEIVGNKNRNAASH